MLHQLTLDSLKDLDSGKAAVAFENHLRRVASDCYDRPADATSRKVTMEIAFTPVMEPDGSCSEVKAQIHVKSSVPTHRTKVYSLGLRPNGNFVFSEHSPDNINQPTLMDDDGE